MALIEVHTNFSMWQEKVWSTEHLPFSASASFFTFLFAFAALLSAVAALGWVFETKVRKIVISKPQDSS